MWKRWIEAAHYVEAGFLFDPEPGPQPMFIGCMLLAAFYEVQHWCLALWCSLFGCTIEMESWAGPDSGGETWHCTRCGAGGSDIYY
jgi:hypothetical protein